MTREAWFCPSCQKHHAPHCDTCPGGTGGIEALPTTPWPVVQPNRIPTRIQPWPAPYTPDPNLPPLIPMWTLSGAYDPAHGLVVIN